jgi:hypothetical protein
MIPTTIAVAAVSPMERLSSVDMQCVKAARFYHAGITYCSADPGVLRRCLKSHRDAHHIVGNKGVRSGSA